VSGAIDRFLAAARELGLEPDVHRFPEGTKTAEDAARAIGCDVAQIVKSLVLTADGRPLLALTSGAHRADTARLAELAGAREVRRATPEEARAATGFAVGGTPPFGHPQPVRAFCDRTLLVHEVVWAAAGTPDSVFPLTAADLLRCTGAEVADFGDPGDA
jgi:prolyl-tRNA editing enzyme YbaK/EbsC (Cys-tRNA(Pro) deacylase)